MLIVRRILAFLIGWALAIVTFFLALAVCFGIAAWLSPQPGYWTAMAVSPVLLVSLPAVVLFLLILSVQASFWPVLGVGLATEIAGWRRPWLFGLCGAGVAAWNYFVFTPRTITGPVDGVTLQEAGLFGLAGGVAGLAYWAVAGRRAGFRAPVEPLP
jgi:hypothetical protein